MRFAVGTTTQILTKEKVFNTNSSVLEISNNLLFSYHDNALVIQNWSGQTKTISMPTITAIKFRKYLVMGTSQGKLFIYNDQGDLLTIIEAHFQKITSIELDEYYLITGSSDGIVKIWYIDQVLSQSFKPVDEYMHMLGVCRIKKFNNIFYSASTDRFIKLYRHRLIDSIEFEDAIADFDVGLHGLCICFRNGQVGVYKDSFVPYKVVDGVKTIRWVGFHIVCATSNAYFEFNEHGDILSEKQIENITSIHPMPIKQNFINKKDIPTLGKTIQKREIWLDIEQKISNSEQFVNKVLNIYCCSSSLYLKL
eukprot:NODE_494_length_6830_cov_0.941613.p4 type:complete len:309 gc:universal NODE_494_length_6830_cov_0.941613:4854-5780(+)